MPRNDRVYLQDILEASRKIAAFTRGFSLDSFTADEKTVDAVVRNLEIIGEAAKAISSELQSQHGDVEWKKMAGLRDLLIHQYFGIDKEIIWDIVQSKIPPLVEQMRRILSVMG